MLIQELPDGLYFRFAGSEAVWLSRGNGWFISPGGYDGGPWHEHDRVVVIHDPGDSHMVVFRKYGLVWSCRDFGCGVQRLTLVVPKNMADGPSKRRVCCFIQRFIAELGFPPCVLTGRKVRVLTGLRVYADV